MLPWLLLLGPRRAGLSGEGGLIRRWCRSGNRVVTARQLDAAVSEGGGLRRVFCLGPPPYRAAGNDPVPKRSHTCSDLAFQISPFEGSTSVNIVGVRRNADGIAAEMNQMRDWLDAHRIEPLLFQLNGAVLSLGFENAGEATAFAYAFDGRVLSEPDARAALQRFALGLVNG
jgi:hypothetical protein